MESTIKLIFEGKKDQQIHDEFVKFSRGIFDNRYLVEAKKQPGKYVIKTGSEFANYFVKTGLEKASGPLKINGVIVATFDVKSEAEFEISGIKQFMGIKQAIVDGVIDPAKVISLMNKMPKAFYALSFNLPDYELKIKPKAPKSAKPSTKGEADIKIDFCNLKTTNQQIVNDLLFGINMTKEVQIYHSVQISEIVLPKGEKDPIKIRENAIRKGKIVRKAIVDGKEIISEKNFEA